MPFMLVDMSDGPMNKIFDCGDMVRKYLIWRVSCSQYEVIALSVLV